MTRNERREAAIKQEMERLVSDYKAIYAKADDEDREPTHSEKVAISDAIAEIERLKPRLEEVRAEIKTDHNIRGVTSDIRKQEPTEKKDAPDMSGMAAQLGRMGFAVPRQRAKSLGEQFVGSKEYKDLRERGFSGSWTTGQVELKATLAEGGNQDAEVADPAAGAGAPLVPIDQRPGIQQILFERLTISDLLAQGTTTSNAIRYVVETVASPGTISTVPEGGAKPEATLTFDSVDDPVRKIASWLPVTDEMLEDAPGLQAYINARLSLFVRQEEENQVLNGNDVGVHLNGLLNRVPVANQGVQGETQTPAGTPIAAQALDHIYAGITQSRKSFLEPDGVVVNTDDWAEIRVIKDSQGHYLGGSPFTTSQYLSSTGGEPSNSLWGKRVVVTSAISRGVALTGSFSQAAQLFRRGGLTVEASNSHASFFTTNLTAIRAEERLGLCVYRPESFVTVATGLS